MWRSVAAMKVQQGIRLVLRLPCLQGILPVLAAEGASGHQ
jgi:hypothetical protein